MVTGSSSCAIVGSRLAVCANASFVVVLPGAIVVNTMAVIPLSLTEFNTAVPVLLEYVHVSWLVLQERLSVVVAAGQRVQFAHLHPAFPVTRSLECWWNCPRRP